LSEERAVRAGLLSLRIADQGERQLIRVSGELDLANASTLEVELERALGNGHGQIVIDLVDLSFIDSTGIALLITAISRDGEEARLRFIPSKGLAVQRVLEVTGLAERLPYLDTSA
jgi:anti-sigma B factor antagonist